MPKKMFSTKMKLKVSNVLLIYDIIPAYVNCRLVTELESSKNPTTCFEKMCQTKCHVWVR